MAQMLPDRAWKVSIKTGQSTLPSTWMDANAFAKITVPKLDQTVIILDTENDQALTFGPIHIRQSPLPGNPGTAIIAAHKNTHFAFLKDMRIGDIIDVQMPSGDISHFKTIKVEIVHKDNSGIPIHTDQATPPCLALVTCYPFDAISYGGPMRYVITANLVKNIESK